MPTKSTGIDVGLRTTKLLRGFVKGNSFVVTDFAVSSHKGSTVTDGWESIDAGFKPGAARVGLTGRDVNIRYTRVPRLPDWQLHKLMRFEVEEVGGQSGSEVASDFNVLPEMPEGMSTASTGTPAPRAAPRARTRPAKYPPTGRASPVPRGPIVSNQQEIQTLEQVRQPELRILDVRAFACESMNGHPYFVEQRRSVEFVICCLERQLLDRMRDRTKCSNASFDALRTEISEASVVLREPGSLAMASISTAPL